MNRKPTDPKDLSPRARLKARLHSLDQTLLQRAVSSESPLSATDPNHAHALWRVRMAWSTRVVVPSRLRRASK